MNDNVCDSNVDLCIPWAFSILSLHERNRCEISGRPHGVYRKLKISRIALRQMASAGKIPGMTKSSW